MRTLRQIYVQGEAARETSVELPSYPGELQLQRRTGYHGPGSFRCVTRLYAALTTTNDWDQPRVVAAPGQRIGQA